MSCPGAYSTSVKSSGIVPDDAVAPQVVADRDRDRQLHRRLLLDELDSPPGEVARGGLEMKDGVEDELELGAARAQHGVEAVFDWVKVFCDWALTTQTDMSRPPASAIDSAVMTVERGAGAGCGRR